MQKIKEEKGGIKLITLVYIVIVLIIILFVFAVYGYHKNKINTKDKEGNKEQQIEYIESIPNNSEFELDSSNKYVIETDYKWLTMRDDGGSHTSIYYQVDLDRKIINKVIEKYEANLGGSPKIEKKVEYSKKFDTDVQEEMKSLLNEIINKDDINENHNYNCFTIASLNIEKSIYNTNSIEQIKNFLKKIDEYNFTNNKNSKELTEESKMIVAEKAYKNYAYGFQYRGKALFNDGTIYEWDYEGKHGDYEVETTEEYIKWILEHGTILNQKATEEDLKEIEQNIDSLEENTDKSDTATAYDAGSRYISVWDKNSKKIELKESGDFTSENKTNNSQKIISIIEKYLN